MIRMLWKSNTGGLRRRRIALECSLAPYPTVRKPIRLSTRAHHVCPINHPRILVALFFQCMGALLNSVNARTRAVKWGLVVHTSFMFTLVAVCGAMYANSQLISYIDKRRFPGVDESPFGSLGYNWLHDGDAITVAPAFLFILNQCLADGFLVSFVRCPAAQVSHICCSSALPLLHHLLHEKLGHRFPMFDVPRLYECVPKPQHVLNETLS